MMTWEQQFKKENRTTQCRMLVELIGFEEVRKFAKYLKWDIANPVSLPVLTSEEQERANQTREALKLLFPQKTWDQRFKKETRAMQSVMLRRLLGFENAKKFQKFLENYVSLERREYQKERASHESRENH